MTLIGTVFSRNGQVGRELKFLYLCFMKPQCASFSVYGTLYNVSSKYNKYFVAASSIFVNICGRNNVWNCWSWVYFHTGEIETLVYAYLIYWKLLTGTKGIKNNYNCWLVLICCSRKFSCYIHYPTENF